MGSAKLPAADSSGLVAGKPRSAMDYQAGIEHAVPFGGDPKLSEAEIHDPTGVIHQEVPIWIAPVGNEHS